MGINATKNAALWPYIEGHALEDDGLYGTRISFVRIMGNYDMRGIKAFLERNIGNMTLFSAHSVGNRYTFDLNHNRHFRLN